MVAHDQAERLSRALLQSRHFRSTAPPAGRFRVLNPGARYPDGATQPSVGTQADPKRPAAPDGTIVWTAPTGRTPPTSARDLMMPTRRRNRSTEREYRMRFQRSLNDANVAERDKPPPF
jgi:hypothetical protein